MHAWEEAHFQALTADIFGFHAIQLGLPEIRALHESRIKHRWQTLFSCSHATPDTTESTTTTALPVSIVHHAAELPFASNSIDLVIMPHVLEFAESPHQVLREVERILIPEGQVIISGFNPASLWGLRQSYGRMSGSHFLPQYAEFISLPRMRDWLKLLNLESNRGHFGCYCPPCKKQAWLKNFGFMEKTGARWWPWMGALYMVQAVKRVPGMHLIPSSFRKKPQRVFQNVPVNNQNMPSKPMGNTAGFPIKKQPE